MVGVLLLGRRLGAVVLLLLLLLLLQGAGVALDGDWAEGEEVASIVAVRLRAYRHRDEGRDGDWRTAQGQLLTWGSEASISRIVTLICVKLIGQ